MPARRVTFQEHEQALATSARIKAKYPDILERLPDGLYRYLLAGPNERQVLFNYLACDSPCSVSPARNSSATCRLNAALCDRCFVMASILWKPTNGGQTNSLILSTPRGALQSPGSGGQNCT